jgi:phage-related minor tail protein
VKVTSDAHLKIISQLREQLEQSQLLYEDHQMHSIIYKAERDEFRRELEVTKADLLTTSEQLREMNKERHLFEDLYNESCKRIESLENIIESLRNKLETS